MDILFLRIFDIIAKTLRLHYVYFVAIKIFLGRISLHTNLLEKRIGVHVLMAQIKI